MSGRCKAVVSASGSPAVWTSVVGNKPCGVDAEGECLEMENNLMSARHPGLYVAFGLYGLKPAKPSGSEVCF